MSRRTQDGTAKPVSRDQILRRKWRQGNIHSVYSADHEQVWQSYLVDLYSDGFTCILFVVVVVVVFLTLTDPLRIQP